MKPKDYQSIVDTSRWGISDDPIIILIFAVPFDEALANMDFEPGDDGRLQVPGGYGSTANAEPFQINRLKGYRADTFFRGFRNDNAPAPDGESNVFSGTIENLVLQDPAGHSMGAMINSDNPDSRHESEFASAIDLILSTIRLR